MEIKSRSEFGLDCKSEWGKWMEGNVKDRSGSCAHVHIYRSKSVMTGWGGCLPGWHSPTESQSVHLRESARFMGEERDTPQQKKKKDKITTEIYVGMFRNVKSLKMIPT